MASNILAFFDEALCLTIYLLTQFSLKILYLTQAGLETLVTIDFPWYNCYGSIVTL